MKKKFKTLRKFCHDVVMLPNPPEVLSAHIQFKTEEEIPEWIPKISIEGTEAWIRGEQYYRLLDEGWVEEVEE